MTSLEQAVKSTAPTTKPNTQRINLISPLQWVPVRLTRRCGRNRPPLLVAHGLLPLPARVHVQLLLFALELSPAVPAVDEERAYDAQDSNCCLHSFGRRPAVDPPRLRDQDFVGGPCPNDRALTPDEVARVRSELADAWESGEMKRWRARSPRTREDGRNLAPVLLPRLF